MNIFVVTYDRPLGLIRNDTEFLNVIRGLGPRSIRPMERTWLIGTNLSVEEIAKQLIPHLQGQGDRLLVTQLSEYYYGLLPPETWEWIKQVAEEYYAGL